MHEKNSAPPVKIKTFQKQELKAVSNKPVDALMKHNVYTFMHDFFGLTEKHRKHLKEVRRLSDEAIDKDFFSITANKKTAFVKALRIKFPEYSTEMLMEIPGFYYDQTYSCLRMSSYEGIGICIRGFDSHIKAIQIRQDVVKPGRSRYVWFASTFAWQKPLLYKGGNGTGAPIDCLYPTRLKRKYAIGIVEGKFKAEILAYQGLFALSVQGVGNWKGGDGWTGIDYEIDQLNYFSALGMDTIYIFMMQICCQITACFIMQWHLVNFWRINTPICMSYMLYGMKDMVKALMICILTVIPMMLFTQIGIAYIACKRSWIFRCGKL